MVSLGHKFLYILGRRLRGKEPIYIVIYWAIKLTTTPQLNKGVMLVECD